MTITLNDTVAFNDYRSRDVYGRTSLQPRPRTRYRDDRRPANGRVAQRRAGAAAPRGVHPLPLDHGGSDRPTVGVTLAAALLTALVVMGILGLAHLRAPQHSGSVPMATAVVQVHGGESLSDVAGRVAPGSPVGAVVDKIMELNGLTSAAVHPGQSLVAPTSSAR